MSAQLLDGPNAAPATPTPEDPRLVAAEHTQLERLEEMEETLDRIHSQALDDTSLDALGTASAATGVCVMRGRGGIKLDDGNVW
jgi:hypothetical protein